MLLELSTPQGPLAALLCLSRVDIFLRLVNHLVAANIINLAGVIRRHLLCWWQVSLSRQMGLPGCAAEGARYAQVENKPWMWRWIIWTHPRVPLTLVTPPTACSCPATVWKDQLQMWPLPLFPSTYRWLHLKGILGTHKLTVLSTGHPDHRSEEVKSHSLQVQAVMFSAAEQLWPTATSELARCLCSYLSCWFLLMQQKEFPSSLCTSNRHDQIRVVMRQNKNTRRNTEAQTLSFMTCLFPFVAQGFMAL